MAHFCHAVKRKFGDLFDCTGVLCYASVLALRSNLDMQRLRWNGNLQAQREADVAFLKLRLKPKKLSKRQRQRLRSKQQVQERRDMPYKQYLLTNHWKKTRQRKLKSTRYECERCHGPAWQVHHKHYRTLWREKNSDLESICGCCHQSHHECLVQADSHLRAINGQSL